MKKSLLLSALFVLVSIASYADPSPKTKIVFYDDNDQQTITLLYNALMSAEIVAQPLNVQVTCDELVSHQLVFGLKTEEMQNVTLTLTEASSQTLVASRSFDITAGNNYKALNISNLPEGQYIITFTRDNKKVMKLIGIVREHQAGE